MYQISCACFRCRKSFKRSVDTSEDGHSSGPKCPECGLPTRVMGRNFRAPAQKDDKQWKKIEILLRTGFGVGAHSNREMGGFPETISQVSEFVRGNWEKRCASCIAIAVKEFGSCPQTQEEIEAFIEHSC